MGAYAGSRNCFGAHKTNVPQPTQISQKEMDKRRKKMTMHWLQQQIVKRL